MMHLTSVALAGAVFAKKRMKRRRRNLQRDGIERSELAETLGHVARFDAERIGVDGKDPDHEIASMNFSELETEPNTPPCILIIAMFIITRSTYCY